MGFKLIAILLLEITLAVAGSRLHQNGSQCIDQVQKNVDNPSVNPIKTIQSEDGDVIECIDIYKQPAFDHPALKNHKIQMVPTHYPTEKIPAEEHEEDESSRKDTTQLWRKSGSCPAGTIPIRRMQSKNLQKASTNQGHYARKKARQYHDQHNQTDQKNKDINIHQRNQRNHSLSVLEAYVYAFHGGKGTIKVWNPRVEFDDEYTTSHVAVETGRFDDYESVKAGWAVNPRVYGDRQTRLFVYWTVDGSMETGCFDATCPGFVQTSNEVALGAAIYPISTLMGLPYEITMFIHRDPYTGNWWVQYQEKINLGYWPQEIFYNLRYHATAVSWGGEVYSTRVGVHPHTATGMGSGRFSDIMFGRSGVIRRMRVLRNGLVLEFPEYVFAYTDEYTCYDFDYLSSYVEDPEFYYGGPGRNVRCP